jgi:ABC-type multidrug transport system fused ATPase/permease subunit
MERVREGLGDKASMFIQFTSAFLAGFAVGFIYNWQLTLVMLSLSPLIAATGAWTARVCCRSCTSSQHDHVRTGDVIAYARRTREIRQGRRHCRAGIVVFTNCARVQRTGA